MRYGDAQFRQNGDTQFFVEVARFWCSRAAHDWRSFVERQLLQKFYVTVFDLISESLLLLVFAVIVISMLQHGWQRTMTVFQVHCKMGKNLINKNFISCVKVTRNAETPLSWISRKVKCQRNTSWTDGSHSADKSAWSCYSWQTTYPHSIVCHIHWMTSSDNYNRYGWTSADKAYTFDWSKEAGSRLKRNAKPFCV